MSGALSPFLQYAITEWYSVQSKGTTLPLPLPLPFTTAYTYTYTYTISLPTQYSTGWTTGVQFPVGSMIGLFSSPRPPDRPGAFNQGANRPRREADRSSPPSAEVKNAWNYTSTPSIRLHGMMLN